MNNPTATPIAPPRIVKGGELLIFGISQRYQFRNIAGIPSQWNRFVPYLGRIPGQVGHTTYGVIWNSDKAGDFDYTCGVEVTEFPANPVEFSRVRVAAHTYAVFEHKDHISSIRATFDYIWNHGLANSGVQPAHAPALEVYGEHFDGRTGLGGLEIWIPIQD